MPATPPSIFDQFVSFSTSEKFIAAFIGLISGTVATLIAPWTKWHFKERELKRDSRKEKIRHWKEDIFQYRNDYDSFKKTAAFYELKNRIPNEELESFDASSISYGENGTPAITVVIGPPSKKIDKVGRFLAIVSEIEKEWGII